MVDMSPHRAVPRLATVLLAATLGLGLAACGADDPSASSAQAQDVGDSRSATDPSAAASTPTESTPTEQEGAGDQESKPAPGRYVTWADYDADRAAYEDGDVVLFFHAPWCPSCRATEEAIDADGVPDGLTIVKVDFDTATDLRQEYGVTVQHTFVAVDPDGTALKKWTGTLSGADIAAELA